MRLLFLILVLTNVLAFAYLRYSESRSSADTQIPLLQIQPEKLKLLKPAPAANQSGSPSSSSQATAACLEWGIFAADDTERAVAALAKLEIADRVAQRASGGDGYWVYIPPLKSKADADKKAGELKALGITDFYVVQDNEQWRYAVSLGAFKTEDAANTLLAQLRQKGVRSALSGPRGATHTTFVVRDPGDAIAARMAELRVEFPATSLKVAPCGSTVTAKNQ